MSEELKPCPFCGGEACYIATEEGFTAYLRIGCKTCWAKSNPVRYRTYYNGLDDEKNPIPPESMKKEAAATWNRRDDADRIAELERQNAELEEKVQAVAIAENALNETNMALSAQNARLLEQNAELRQQLAAESEDSRDAARYHKLQAEAKRDYVEFNDIWYESTEDLDAGVDALAQAGKEQSK